MCVYILWWICFQTPVLYDCLRNSFRWGTTQYSDYAVSWMTKEMWFNPQHSQQIVICWKVSRPGYHKPSILFSGYFRIKWQECEAWDLPPWNAKVKIDWRSMSTPLYVVMVCAWTTVPVHLIISWTPYWTSSYFWQKKPKWLHPNHPEFHGLKQSFTECEWRVILCWVS